MMTPLYLLSLDLIVISSTAHLSHMNVRKQGKCRVLPYYAYVGREQDRHHVH